MLAGRVLLVAALLPNGLRKLADFYAIAAGIGGMPQMVHGHIFPAVRPLFYFPAPELFLAASVIFDIGASLLVMFGLRARAAALGLAIYCAFATVIYHYDLANPENVRAVMRNLSLIGGLLFVGGSGAGAWALDARRGRRLPDAKEPVQSATGSS
jgi:putative oxidoreductase